MLAGYEIFDAVSRVAVSALLYGLWQGLIVTLAVGCLLGVARWLNARTRYVIWTTTLLVVFTLCWSEGWDPPDRAGAARIWYRASEVSDPEMPGPRKRSEAAAFESAPGAGGAKVREHAEQGVAPELPGQWPPLVFAVWMLVSLALTTKLILGFRHMRRLKRSARPLSARYQHRLRHLYYRSETRRWVRLCSSTRVRTPAATGLFKPVILIPESMLDRLTEAEFDQVVLHELAHLHRLDDWTKLFQALVGCVLFFHPAVWWIARQMDLERGRSRVTMWLWALPEEPGGMRPASPA